MSKKLGMSNEEMEGIELFRTPAALRQDSSCALQVMGLWLCLSQTLAEVRNRTERHGLLRESTRLPPVIRSWLYTGLASGPQLPEGRTASPSGTRAPPAVAIC